MEELFSSRCAQSFSTYKASGVLASFWKPEACGQTVLPDRSILKGQKWVENAKIEKLKYDILGDFHTLCILFEIGSKSIIFKFCEQRFFEFPAKNLNWKSSFMSTFDLERSEGSRRLMHVGKICKIPTRRSKIVCELWTPRLTSSTWTFYNSFKNQ